MSRGFYEPEALSLVPDDVHECVLFRGLVLERFVIPVLLDSQWVYLTIQLFKFTNIITDNYSF